MKYWFLAIGTILIAVSAGTFKASLRQREPLMPHADITVTHVQGPEGGPYIIFSKVTLGAGCLCFVLAAATSRR
jgi:hypothetical protein